MATAAAVLAAALAGCDADKGERVEPGPTPPRIETVVQDDALMLHTPPGEVRFWAQQMARHGVDRVRITAGWAELAPRPRSKRRPRDFDASDPGAYRGPGIDKLDRAIREVTAEGLEPMIDIAFWAPRWAVTRRSVEPREQRWRPSPREFGAFSEAIARRYGGDFRGLPEVRLWTTWNEPNHSGFLLPQWTRRGGRWQPVSPHHYREMHERGYEAIKRASKRNRVLIGGLSSGGTSKPTVDKTMAPLLFLRELACVDRRLRPLAARARPACRDFRPLRADGFAHHPYDLRTPPGVPRGGQRAGTGDLGRLSELLAALHRRGRTQKRLELYLTEYGYETNPPDPRRGISLERQAVYLSQATALVLGRDDVRMHAQFAFRDLPEDRLYQTGLFLPDGRSKPALQAFRLPFWIDRRTAIGQVRPGSGRQPVALERAVRRGVWRQVGKPFPTDRDGVYRRKVGKPGLYRLRWRRERSLPARAR